MAHIWHVRYMKKATDAPSDTEEFFHEGAMVTDKYVSANTLFEAAALAQRPEFTGQWGELKEVEISMDAKDILT